MTLHDDGIVELTRSSAHIEGLDDFLASLRAIEIAVEAELARGSNARAALVDSRAAPSRNDEAFESKTAPYRNKIRTMLPRSAVLVRTEVGKLQIQRLEREAGRLGETSVFTDREEALAYLRTP